MKFIGITGGVGAGKSEILHFIEREYPARIVLADMLAHELMLPHTECFRNILDAFGKEDILTEEGMLDAAKVSAVIFSDRKKREKMNGIVHPAVKREALRLVEEERKRGICRYFILEAALLIEEGYDKICDELWYIRTPASVRRSRLKESRGYSDGKIDAILKSQLSETEYERRCRRTIDNGGSLEETFCRIRNIFAEIENGENII